MLIDVQITNHFKCRERKPLCEIRSNNARSSRAEERLKSLVLTESVAVNSHADLQEIHGLYDFNF